MARDEFSPGTKSIIAKRAGNLCSFPGCGKITSSPSEESSIAINSDGMACHISAASSGKNARRYDPLMTPEQRSHPDNGIWMCSNHGTQIDKDETRFTIEILHHWKKSATEVIRLMHEKNIHYQDALKYKSSFPLANHNIYFDTLTNENNIIGDSLIDSCVHIRWGEKFMHCIRDYLIEHTRNAFSHGKATRVNIDISYNSITICDNGRLFNTRELLTMPQGSGGKISLEYLLKHYNDRAVISTFCKEKLNKTVLSLLDESESIFDITPCAIQINLDEFRNGVYTYEIVDSCQELFVVLPKYFALSDLLRNKREDALLNETRPITFIGQYLSNNIIEQLKRKYPHANLIEL